jgi:hypothetical protein
MPALTGDITSSAGAVATALSVTGVAAATYGSTSAIPVLTVDAKGRVTAASTAAVTVSGVVAGANGGTGQSSFTVGDFLYASTTTELSKLANVATGNVLLSGGVGTASAWGKVGLTTHVSGTLPVGNGGVGTSAAPTDGQLWIGHTANGTPSLATLTGTTNQVTVTNSAGGITLATPQSIGTSSTPQFQRLGVGTGADAVAGLALVGGLKDTYTDVGNSGAAATFDLSTGRWQKLTLTGNATLTANNPVAGVTYTLFLKQDAAGSRTVTWFSGIRWAGGAAPTLTVTGLKYDLITCRYDGTEYFCSVQANY